MGPQPTLARAHIQLAVRVQRGRTLRTVRQMQHRIRQEHRVQSNYSNNQLLRATHCAHIDKHEYIPGHTQPVPQSDHEVFIGGAQIHFLPVGEEELHAQAEHDKSE